MGRGAVVVELGRLRGIGTGKAQGTGTLADVERLGLGYFIGSAIHDHHARATDIDKAKLAPLQEIGDAKGLAELIGESQRPIHRHDAAEYDAVDVAVSHGQPVRAEDLFHQKLTAQALGVELFGVIAVDALTSLHCEPQFRAAGGMDGDVSGNPVVEDTIAK
ncbi:hypothetical protein D3C72_1866090 [compost metagenome]